MKVWIVGAIGLLLGACAQTPPPAAPVEQTITISTAGPFDGVRTIMVFADNRVGDSLVAPFGDFTNPPVTVVDGAYGRVLGQLRALLPAAIDGAAQGTCADYKPDTITIIPPIEGMSGVSVACPDADVTALIGAIVLAIMPIEPL